MKLFRLIVFCFLSGTAALPAFGQSPCRTFRDLAVRELSKGDSANYIYVLKQLNAYRICDPGNAAEVDSMIISVNRKIIAQKDRALKDRLAALAAEDRATKAANRATALYYASEAGKLPPAQAVHLLLQGRSLDTTVTTVTEQLHTVFNNPDNYHFSEQLRIRGLFRFFNEETRLSRHYLFESDNRSYLLTLEPELIIAPLTFKTDRFDLAEVSDNGQYIALDNRYGNPQYDNVIDISTGRLPVFLSHEEADKTDYTFSADGKLLIGQSKKSLKIWDMDSRLLRRSFSASADFVRCDNLEKRLIVLQKPDSSTVIYDLDHFQHEPFLTLQKAIYRLSSDKHWLFTTSGDSVTLWDLGGSRRIAGTFARNQVAPSPDIFNGRWVLLSGQNRFFDLYTHKFYDLADPDFSRPAFSANQKFLLLSGNNQPLRPTQPIFKLIRLKDGKPAGFLDSTVYQASFSRDKKFLMTRDKQSRQQVWDLNTEQELTFIDKDNVSDVALISKQHWLMVKYNDYKHLDQTTFWDYDTEQRLSFFGAHKSSAMINFTADSTWMVLSDMGIFNDQIFRLDSSGDQPITETTAADSVTSGGSPHWILVKNNNEITDVVNQDTWHSLGTIRGDNKPLTRIKTIGFSANEHFAIVEAAEGKTIFAMQDSLPQYLYDKKIRDYAFSANKEWVIVTKSDSTGFLMNTLSKNLISFTGSPAGTRPPWVSADNKYYAYQDRNGFDQLKEIATGKTPLFFPDSIRNFGYFQPEHRILLVSDHIVRSVDLLDGTNVSFPKATEQYCFSNGRLAIIENGITGQRQAASLYDLASGQKITLPVAGSGYLHFTGDHGQFIVSEEDRNLTLWQYTGGRWMSFSGTGYQFTQNGHYLIIRRDFPRFLPKSRVLRDSVRVIDLISNKEVVCDILNKERNGSTITISTDDHWMIADNRLYRLNENETTLQCVLKGYNYLFSADSRHLGIQFPDHIETWDLTSNQQTGRFWINKNISSYLFSADSKWLYMTAGKCVARFSLQKPGDQFSWGDGEGFDYGDTAIRNWLKKFGPHYLPTLNELTKIKYAVKMTAPNQTHSGGAIVRRKRPN